MRGIRCWALLAPLLSLTGGCWQARYFEPREHQNGTGPGGDVAAAYQFARADDGTGGAAVGEVRIWSEGAKARYDGDVEVVDLHVGLEVENNGLAPLELDVDSLVCEELVVDGLVQQPLSAHGVVGSGYAPPGTTARVDVVFRPPTTYPRDVDGFAVRFRIQDDRGDLLSQSTPFGPAYSRTRRGGFYGGGLWGPYWGGYWGGGAFWGPGYYGGYWGPGFGYGFGPRGCW